MPIGIVSDSDFEVESNKLSNPPPVIKGQVIDINRGRGIGNGEVPEVLRKIISEEAINGTPASELSAVFGVSQSSISAYKHGATSTSSYNLPSDSLVDHNVKVKNKILKLSRRKMLSALNHMTADKLESSKATELSIIAKNMSSIAADMEPSVSVKVSNTQVLVYKPRMKEEDEYEVLTVNE